MPDSLDFIRLQTQLYTALRAAPADALSDLDRAILALLEVNHRDTDDLFAPPLSGVDSAVLALLDRLAVLERIEAAMAA